MTTPPTPSPSDPDDTPLVRAIHAALHYEPPPQDVALSIEDRAVVDDVVPWLRTLTRSEDSEVDVAPIPAAVSPSRDPIALALGLVVDPTRRVSGSALRAARQAVGIGPSVIATRLSQRGWTITTREVFDWEKNDPALSPALSADVARLLGVSLDRLVHDSGPPAWRAMLEYADIERALSDIADSVLLSNDDVALRLDRVLAGAAHRNESSLDRASFLAFLDFVRRHPYLLGRP